MKQLQKDDSHVINFKNYFPDLIQLIANFNPQIDVFE